ncbi:MAG: hypothetical protein ACJ79S_07090, partial [Gemmatimonadaceae bacterium]
MSDAAPAPANPPAPPPTRARRALVALLAGVWGFSLAYLVLRTFPDKVAGDFTTAWRAALALLQGQDPFQVIRPSAYPFDYPMYYPLPAAFVGFPFATLRPAFAGALFFGGSSALLGYVATRESYARLPLFLSVPYLFAAHGTQWAPLIMAVAMLPGPWQGWLVAKPNLGLALWLWRPTWKGVLGGALILAASIALLPSWPLDWLHNARSSPFARVPLATLPGPILLLAALRWRTPEGRLLLAMACIPQFPFFYDALPLWLVARTQREALNLTWCSWAAFAGWLAFSFDWTTRNVLMPTALPWVVALIY